MNGAICWVILEGQNFAASILDTQDLSTIRGGSLLLRDLVGEAEAALQQRFPGAVTRATVGGSVGIWRVAAAADSVAPALVEIRSALASGPGLHLGFGLAAVADDGTGYARQRLRLRAAMQRARLAEVRVPYPDLTMVEAGVCPVDLVRPIGKFTQQRIGPDPADPRHLIKTSTAVRDRRRFGIDKKQKLIREETSRARLNDTAQATLQREGRPFAMQIGSISEQAAPPKELKANLRDKICVIALDGNGFGKIQDAALALSDTIETQLAFDLALAEVRSELIARVFSRVIDEGGEGVPCPGEAAVREELKDPIRAGKPVIRFELLLWGGDEIMFIVPARIGWDILLEFGEVAGKASILGRPVSFSVGAVFCHHDAPIARVKRLADGLCSHIKQLKPDIGGGRDGKAATLFMVKVLESFDHVGMDLSAHLARRLPKPLGVPFSAAAAAAFTVLDLAELGALRVASASLVEGEGGDLSRGRLRQTAFALHRGAAPGAEFAGTKWVDYVRESKRRLAGKAASAAQQNFSVEPEDRNANAEANAAEEIGLARFFTLLDEYWDYLTPIREASDKDVKGAA